MVLGLHSWYKNCFLNEKCSTRFHKAFDRVRCVANSFQFIFLSCPKEGWNATNPEVKRVLAWLTKIDCPLFPNFVSFIRRTHKFGNLFFPGWIKYFSKYVKKATDRILFMISNNPHIDEIINYILLGAIQNIKMKMSSLYKSYIPDIVFTYKCYLRFSENWRHSNHYDMLMTSVCFFPKGCCRKTIIQCDYNKASLNKNKERCIFEIFELPLLIIQFDALSSRLS